MTANMTMRPAGVRQRAARLATVVLSLAAALLAAGCMELNVPQPSAQPMETKPEQTTADLAAKADGFWKEGNPQLSELLYSRLLERADLEPQERLQALDRLALSAFRAKHYHQAKLALDRRAAADKGVLGSWGWHSLYLKTLMALSRIDLLDTHQAWIMAHTELPFEVRARAIMTFAEYVAQSGDPARALNLLAEIHRQAPDAAAKAQFENLFAASLRDLPEEQLAALSRQVGPRPGNVFPHALIQREAARRAQRLHSGLAPAAASIPGGTLLAQNATRARTGTDQPAALLQSQPAGVTTVALVLPLTGRFAATGQKVLRGAGAAQKRLAGQGRKLDIKVINAESPDWRAQLAALPPDVAVVGGPLLNADAMRSLQADGTLTKRAVFAFQPDLGAIPEGRQAWRFYPSLQDQARALLSLTADGLGIRSVAVLAPKNRYGQRMAEVFQAEAKARGLRVAGSETYPPDDHARWIHSVSRLLKIPDGFRRNKNMPLPMPDFGAVFLPEDWSQAEMLTSNFYFFEGQHLLFLGTDLWSVGLDNAKEIDDTYFQHAACPGAWWPETNGARALQALLDAQNQGQADFWVALGYDFVRLAARLNLGADWTPAAVNARLAGLKDLDYSMAPVLWNADGVARQSLYVFTPRKEGKALVDAPSMRESIEKARDRREKRLSSSREMQKNKKGGGNSSLTRDAQ
jgi:hypothetical protein